MAAGVVDPLLTMETLYDAVMDHEKQRQKRVGYDRLIAKRMRQCSSRKR